LATALQHFWMARGSVGEGRAWLDRALAAAGTVAPEVRADALVWASYFAFLQDDFAQATALAQESLTLWRSTRDNRGTAFALSLLGNVAAAQYELTTAIPFYEEALALHRAAGDQGDVGGALANLGLTVGLTGDYARAASLLEEAITLCDSAGEQRTAALARLSLGEVVRMQGEPMRAALLLADALGRFQRMGDTTGGIAECWEGLAGVAATLDPVRAARLLGAADALRERLGHPLAPALHPRYAATLDIVRSALESAVFAAAWEAGRHLAVEQASAEARAVVKLSSSPEKSAHQQSVTRSHNLTTRELEVLRLVAAGHSDREIAAALYITRYTAMVHLKNIRRKLGVDSRAAVASYAVRLGLV
jgi:DNA-binding CsgD family transcriptional regulator